MSRAVILLKSPPRVVDDDYVQQFLSSGYKSYFIEVLHFTFSNENLLEDTIRTGPNDYVGVVVTSSRAAEAWLHALNSVDRPGNWSLVPFYVVGEATAHTLKQMTTSHPSYFSDNLIMGAAKSGSSESLAEFVLTDLPTRSGNGKLLYLTGDKNKDTFNRIMSEGGVDVDSLCVYETMAANNLEDEIDRVARKIEQEHAAPIWIVFFAPSSSDFTLRHLRRHFQWSEVVAELGTSARMSAKLAAIGPTTANFLRNERGLRVDAVASKPIPKQLVKAICDVDKTGDKSGA